MDQQFDKRDWFADEPETPAETSGYCLGFAEDLYEVPAQIEQRPIKFRKKHREGKSGMTTLGWVALALVIALVSSLTTALVLDARWQKRFDSMSLAMQDKNTALQNRISAMETAPGTAAAQTGESGWLTPGQVYYRNVDAVVAISAYGQGSNMFGQSGTYQSMGSGFIISQDGYIVSNYHVVQDTDTVEVLTADGGAYEAVLVGYDDTNDIALLKVEAEGLPYVTLGSSSKLQVGDQVAAIGNPLGDLTSTLTVGYISAKDRIVTTEGATINMLQTDAAINSGNSGGPLFNMQGEVVGITTAKFSGTSESGVSIEGIGFAIPMDDVIGMIEDLRDLGYVSGAYLGVMVMDVDPTAQNYGLPAGAFVDEVTPGYAAEAAGIRAKDIIIDLGGYEITGVTELTRMLRKFEPGQTVSVTVYREGKQVTLQVKLDEKPREQTQTQPQQAYPTPGSESFEDRVYGFMDDFFGG